MGYFVCSLCTTCFVQKNVLSKQPCLICSHEFFHVAVPHIPLLSTIPASCNEVLHREGFAENDLGIPDKQVGVKASAEGDFNGLPTRETEMAGPEKMVPDLTAAGCARTHQ